MGTHGGWRIDQTGSVLDLQAGDGIGVVAGPNLRHIIQEASIKAPTATRTAFKQDRWIGSGQFL